MEETRQTGALGQFSSQAVQPGGQKQRDPAAALKTILDALPALVLVAWDRDALDVETNPAARSLLPPELEAVRGRVQQVAADGLESSNVVVDLPAGEWGPRHLLGSTVPLLDMDGELRGAVAAFVDVSAQRRAQDRQSHLLDLVSALAGAATPAQVAQVVVTQVQRVLGPVAAALADRGPRGTLEVLHSQGMTDDEVARWRSFPVAATSPVTEVLRLEEDRWFERRADWDACYPRGVPGTQGPGMGALACLSLSAQGSFQGVLWMAFPGPRHFLPEDLALAREMASHAALALQRARLLETEQQHRRAAQAESVSKDQMLAIISHELRNPLASITLAAEVLLRTVHEEGRLRHAAEIIDRNARLQARLVEDLLDLSRLTQEKIQLQCTTQPLDRVVRSAVEAFQPLAGPAGLVLDVSVEPGLWVHADADRMHQVLSNLLGNALKFTPVGGRVSVSAHRAGDWARVEVADTGIGLAAEMVGSAFDIFQPGETVGRGRGLGIGLALVKGLTELQGGRVEASSAGAGQGSRFTVELPLVPAPDLRAAERAAVGRGRHRLLLVEDNPDTRLVLAESLRMAGFLVDEAGGGVQAMERAREVSPDLLVCDICLPDLDGYEVLRRLRAQPGLRHIPAFAVTSRSHPADVALARQAGFEGHFAKPVDLGVLEIRIRERMSAHYASTH